MRVTDAIATIRGLLASGSKIIICGNGGSAAQADHFAGEMIASGYPCIPLTNNTINSALKNDYSGDLVFYYQVMTLGKRNDILIPLTTSDLSANIEYAKIAAQKKGMYIILPLKKGDTQKTQEYHLRILHKIWRGVCE